MLDRVVIQLYNQLTPAPVGDSAKRLPKPWRFHVEHHHETKVEIESCLCDLTPSYMVTITCLTCASTLTHSSAHLDMVLAITETALRRDLSDVSSSSTVEP